MFTLGVILKTIEKNLSANPNFSFSPSDAAWGDDDDDDDDDFLVKSVTLFIFIFMIAHSLNPPLYLYLFVRMFVGMYV